MTPSRRMTSERPGGAGGQRFGPLAVVGAGAIAVVAALFVWWSAGARLDRSPAGFEGLTLWLRANGMDARMFRGGDTLTRERVGLRILALHDVDLDRPAPEPETKRDRLLASTERDITRFAVGRKIALLPTLVVLPKWRAGVRSLKLAHPELLVDRTAAQRAARQTLPRAGALRRTPGWSAVAVDTPGARRAEARLYHAQSLRGAPCETLIGGTDGGMLLGRCRIGRTGVVHVLTDPDLFNNHGLSQGENAEIALAWIRRLAGDKPVLVDATNRIWASSGRRAPPRERTWSDLARLFSGPFAALWAALGLMAALVLWRASVRDRAPIPPPPDGFGASRAAAIEAKARLLRLSGHDAALTRAHLGDRLQALAAEALGPHRATGAAGVAQLRRALARRSAALAQELDRFAREDQPPHGAGPAELLSYLDAFDRFVADAKAAFALPTPAAGAGAGASSPGETGSPIQTSGPRAQP